MGLKMKKLFATALMVMSTMSYAAPSKRADVVPDAKTTYSLMTDRATITTDGNNMPIIVARGYVNNTETVFVVALPQCSRRVGQLARANEDDDIMPLSNFSFADITQIDAPSTIAMTMCMMAAGMTTGVRPLPPL